MEIFRPLCKYKNEKPTIRKIESCEKNKIKAEMDSFDLALILRSNLIYKGFRPTVIAKQVKI